MSTTGFGQKQKSQPGSPLRPQDRTWSAAPVRSEKWPTTEVKRSLLSIGALTGYAGAAGAGTASQ